MSNIHSKLPTLYEALVDNSETFELEMIEAIKHPIDISNPNKFSTLLVTLNNKKFIEPLLLQISLGEKGDVWLSDFLFAAAKLLSEISNEDQFNTPKNLVPKLSDWIINSTGELAWMAAGLLKFSPSKKAEKIQLLKLEQRGDFFLTYVECILGLLDFHENKYLPLVKQIEADETRDIKLREFCREVGQKV